MKSAGLSNLVVIAGGVLAWATYAWVGAGDLFVVLALMSVVIPAVVIGLLEASALIRIGLGASGSARKMAVLICLIRRRGGLLYIAGAMACQTIQFSEFWRTSRATCG